MGLELVRLRGLHYKGIQMININEDKASLNLKEGIKHELETLEQKAIMPRGAREAFIALCEQQGAALGKTKEQIYAANPFYKGLIDNDNAAKALRVQL